MGKLNMGTLRLEILEQIKDLPSQKVSVDSSHRITLKGVKASELYEMYKLFYLADGTIILRPLVVTEPENVVKPETVARIMQSVDNAKKGKVGETFNPDDSKTKSKAKKQKK